MPAGDANRTWFPELVEMLRSRWHSTMELDELICVTGELDKMLQSIRTTRNIEPAMMWCPKCQARVRSAPPRVSVRAAILALGRFSIADTETVKNLEKRWKKHRQAYQLDLYGSTTDTETSSEHAH